MTLFQVAVQVQRELRMDLSCLEKIEQLSFLTKKQWEAFLHAQACTEMLLLQHFAPKTSGFPHILSGNHLELGGGVNCNPKLTAALCDMENALKNAFGRHII